MPNLYQYKGRMVTAELLRELRTEAKAAVKEEVKAPVDKLQALRDKYEESHPEKREVPGNMRNNVEWINKKIAEFTN